MHAAAGQVPDGDGACDVHDGVWAGVGAHAARFRARAAAGELPGAQRKRPVHDAGHERLRGGRAGRRV